MAPHMTDRLRASGIHVMISASIAALCAALVFGVWYPGLLSTASGVTTIFLILLGVDIALGPLITLCIFNKKKPELKRDLAIVGLIQIAALLYGMHTVFIVRPAYLMFTVDRFDLVFANDLDEKKLATASLPEFRSMPLTGPRTATAQMPDSATERTAMMFDSLKGADDLQHLPKYYRPYATASATVIAQAKPLQKLTGYNQQQAADVAALIRKYQDKKMEVGFVPLKGKKKDLVVVISKTDGAIMEIADLQPW